MRQCHEYQDRPLRAHHRFPLADPAIPNEPPPAPPDPPDNNAQIPFPYNPDHR
jgi:hypothetical protein